MNTIRPRCLGDDELSQLLNAAAAIGGSVYLFMLLMILTGQRAREVEMVAWTDFDFEMDLWLRSSSVGYSRRSCVRPLPLPLSELAHQSLTDAARNKSEMNNQVICRAGSEQQFRARLHRVITRQNADNDAVGKWSVHNLRRTFERGIVMSGAGLEILSEIMLRDPPGFREHMEPLSSKRFIMESRPPLERWSRHVRKLLEL